MYIYIYFCICNYISIYVNIYSTVSFYLFREPYWDYIAISYRFPANSHDFLLLYPLGMVGEKSRYHIH